MFIVKYDFSGYLLFVKDYFGLVSVQPQRGSLFPYFSSWTALC
jgi:hypothetical protein